MDKYRVLQVLGDGSYGTVKKAQLKGTRDMVAIKKLKKRVDSWADCSELPEIVVLRKLHHPNIIKLKEVIREADELYLVFDYMDCTLIEFLTRNPSSSPLVVPFIRQAFEGLAYLHRSGYMHRDIKPENVLVFGDQCKLSDFGLAKRLGNPKNTDYVSTRWYRAPEMLLHSPSYTCSVDNFAMGCIIAEIYLGRPLFPGSNEDDQLDKITEILGTPHWPDGDILARRCGFKFKTHPGVLLADVIRAPRQAIRLIELLLRWDPNERYTAAQALGHPFLSEVGAKKKLPIYPEQSSERVFKPSCKRF